MPRLKVDVNDIEDLFAIVGVSRVGQSVMLTTYDRDDDITVVLLTPSEAHRIAEALLKVSRKAANR